MHSVKSTLASVNHVLFIAIIFALLSIGYGSIPTCICPKDPIYVPLNQPTTVYVSAFGSNSLLFATTSLPIFASNFTTKTGPIITGSILPPSVNVSIKLTPLVASNGTITVSFTDALTGSVSCTITYIGYTGPTCTVLQTTLFASVGEVYTATVIGFSPNSRLTAKASNLPAHTNGSIITNTTTLNSVVVITAIPGVPAMEVINVQFFDKYGFNTTCSVSYTVTVGSTTNAPTSPQPTTPAPTTTQVPPSEYTTYTDYYPTYTTSPPTDAPTTQPPQPTTANTPTCNAPASPVYLPIGLPTTIRVSVTGKHSLVVTTVNLPSFAQLMNGVSAITSGTSLSASANVSVVLQPLLALNGSFSLVFADATDLVNSYTSCVIRFITYTGPTCISAQASVLAALDQTQANAYVGAIVGFSPISSLTVSTNNLPVGVSVAINNTLVPVTYVAAVSRSSALNSSATVYATFMDSYGFNATCFLNITAVANASLLITSAPPTTRRPTGIHTVNPTTSSPTTVAPVTAIPTTSTSSPTSAVPTTSTPSVTTVAATTQAPSFTTVSPTTTQPVTSSATTASPTAVTVNPTSSTTVRPTQVATQAPVATTAAPTVSVVTTSNPSTTSLPTSQVSTSVSPVTQNPTTVPASTTATPTSEATTQPAPTNSFTLLPPTNPIVVTVVPPTIPVAVTPQSFCPASVHLVLGLAATISVQVQAQGSVRLQAQNAPSFALFSNSHGSIALGATFDASENVTITLTPRVAVDGSFILSFVDPLSLLSSSCTIAYDVYSGPSCSVNQPSSSVFVGSTLVATVSGVSAESSLTVSSANVSSDVKISTSNNVVTVSASPLSAKNESLSITFTDKYGLSATCNVSLKAVENVLAHLSAAPSLHFDVFFAAIALLVSVVLL